MRRADLLLDVQILLKWLLVAGGEVVMHSAIDRCRFQLRHMRRAARHCSQRAGKHDAPNGQFYFGCSVFEPHDSILLFGLA